MWPPWLSALIESGGVLSPLPVSSLAKFSALATVHDGGLVATISSVPPTTGLMAGKPPPLITMGVAKRSRYAPGAWEWPRLLELRRTHNDFTNRS